MGQEEGQLGLDRQLLAIGSKDGQSGIQAEFIQGVFKRLPPHLFSLVEGS
jgi:hypothetical protein